MTTSLGDILPSVLMMAVLSPFAVLSFRYGLPIELIVFSLLVAGYKGPRLLSGLVKSKADSSAAPEGTSARSGAGGSSPNSSNRSGAGSGTGSKDGEVISGNSASSSSSSQRWGLSWRRSSADTKSWRSQERAAPAEPTLTRKTASALSALKKSGPQLQWRGIINKFAPEKFDKLCEQLLATLPQGTEDAPLTDDEFRKTLEELLALIFEASSRQHQYTEMYTDLCQKLLDFIAERRPGLDSKSCVWGKCQLIFKTNVLTAPTFPDDLPEDERMDRKAKHKEKMVGIVKFGADLVSRGLVPCDGVMLWIQRLLSEKQETSTDQVESAEEREKDGDQREVQLELLCAILAGMGSVMSDSNTFSEDNRNVIEEVFSQLEQLSMDTARLSLRIRCLIRDVLDLRIAQWKEKEGKLKPGMLQRRGEEEEASNLREDAPEFVPGSRTGWSSQRATEQGRWIDPQLLTSLQAVEHHVEVIKDIDLKLERLKGLVKLYHLIQEKQLVIVANASSVRRVIELISEAFSEISFHALDFSMPEAARRQSIQSFEAGQTSVLIMASEVSTRRDFDIATPAAVLVNFDFPMTLQLYLYRIFKRADKDTHVYTFFSPRHDQRHCAPLMLAMESAGQKVPDALKKLRDQINSESNNAAGGDKGDKGRGRGRDCRDGGRKGMSKGDGEDRVR